MESITKFDGKYAFLSNFYPCKIEYEGMRYPSVEHAYQAAKTDSVSDRKYIACCESAKAAKRFGKTVKLVADWDSVKGSVMLKLLRIKFNQPKLCNMLISTNDAQLVEGNTWNDTFWGVCNGMGDNMLGKLLMQVRSEVMKRENSKIRE